MCNELFISIDVETLGPCPGKHPMVELGAVAFNINGIVIDSWHSKLLRDGWETDSETMKWWHQPKNFPIFEKLGDHARPPNYAMPDFLGWVEELGGQPTIVAYPAGFDFSFLHFYLLYYVGRLKPLSFSCIDIKTYVMAALKKRNYREVFKKKFPRAWFHSQLPHTHGALDDALEQGFMFIQAHRANLGLPLLSKDHELTPKDAKYDT